MRSKRPIATTRIRRSSSTSRSASAELGHKREAVREYRAYLNNVDNAENRDSVRQIIGQLERDIAAEDQRAAAAAAAARTKATDAMVTAPKAAATATIDPTAATLTASAPAPAEHKPAYKKWWVWTIVGGVVAAGAATGLAIAFTRPGSPTAMTSLGTSIRRSEVMMRTLALLTLAAAIGGCANSVDSLVVVDITADQPLGSVSAFAVTATAGSRVASFRVTPPGGAATFDVDGSGQSFGIDLPKGVSGALHVHVDALDAPTRPWRAATATRRSRRARASICR